MTSTVIETVTDNTHTLIELTHELLRVAPVGVCTDIIRSQLGILYSQMALLEPTVDSVEDTRVKLSSLAL
jgi:hypothetical protein